MNIRTKSKKDKEKQILLRVTIDRMLWRAFIANARNRRLNFKNVIKNSGNCSDEHSYWHIDFRN